ncbi:cytoplasmic dynein 2 intermediate chain 2-like [Euwallacea fornicatus]|uniref:cytoplasmic dynein 2 intermediate chain 2-like n=1 Tax=Euwallacea fornicatus TaxID=995702 RepID=UPI00338F24E1
MFSVKHNECVGFESKWKVTKVSTNSASQTTEFAVSEKSCSATKQKSQEIQTDSQENPSAAVDMEKLAQWLHKIYPEVKEQLRNASDSKVFQNYRLLDEPADASCKLLQTLEVASSRNEGSKAVPIITSLQWNCTGSTVAVPYNYKHKTWCYHSGVVCIYVLTRDQKLSETPKKRLSTESCVTTTKFHPMHSNILAAGTFTGHLYVWNTENDLDPLISNTIAHDEYVTQVSWSNDVNSDRTVYLASSSTEGLIKIWSLEVTENLLQLKTIYKIKTPILAKINQSTEVHQSVLDKGDLGVVGFDFSKHIPDMFLVALEGGLIVRCSVLGATEIKGNKGLRFYDPVYKYYEPHKGEILSIKCSPHKKEMFLTCGTEGEIRIYVLDQDDPARVIFTKTQLNDICYVLHEEKLLGACGANGVLEVYHLITGKLLELNFNVKVSRRTLTSLAINGAKTHFVVTGNSNGEVQLWSVPWQNIEFQNRE